MDSNIQIDGTMTCVNPRCKHSFKKEDVKLEYNKNGRSFRCPKCNIKMILFNRVVNDKKVK